MRLRPSKSAPPVDAMKHGHGGETHIHSYGNYLHRHALRDICKEPECATFPEHKAHTSPKRPY